MKVARSTRSGRDTPASQAERPSLYWRPRWQKSSTPLGRAFPARNMVRFFKVPGSRPAIFSCLLLIIEVSASKYHVLDEQAKRIGEGVVHVGAYVLTGDHLAAGQGHCAS